MYKTAQLINGEIVIIELENPKQSRKVRNKSLE
jgi:hypothetical protein